MKKKKVKGAFCPNCHKKLFRMKVKKPTKCNYCGFEIFEPKKIFVPKSKYLKLKQEGKL